MTAQAKGVDVLRAEIDARTLYDLACIREQAQTATREDVEVKAIALRNFQYVAVIAELIAADMEFDEARAAWLNACPDGLGAIGEPAYDHPATIRMDAARERRADALLQALATTNPESDQ